MVVVKTYSGTQIDELPSMTGRVVYDSTLNTLRFHNSTNYSNILAVKDTSNNMNGVNNLRTTGNVGINTTAADRQVEINSATGDCLRLTYNDSNGSATNYTDLLISSGGDLSITPSGGDSTFNSTMSITGITTLSNTTASTSNATGALKLSGGIGISNTTDSASTTNGGSFTTAGGAAVAKKLYVGDGVFSTNLTLNSTSIVPLQSWNTTISGLSASRIREISYSPTLGMYVAILSSDNASTTTVTNTYYTSTNGTSWTARTLPVSSVWASIVWHESASVFNIFPRYGEAVSMPYYTTDGINWTICTGSFIASTRKAYYSSVYGATLLFRNNNTQESYSTDGIAWDYVTRVVQQGASDTQGLGYTAISIPGSNYTYRFNRGTDVINIGYTNTTNIATNDTAISKSTTYTNGIPTSSAYSSTLDILVIVRYNTSGTGSTSEAIMYNTSPKTTPTVWSFTNAPIAANWIQVIWSSAFGMFIAISNDATPYIMTSTNGTEWTTLNNLPSGVTQFSAIGYNNSAPNLIIGSNSTSATYPLIQEVSDAASNAQFTIGSTIMDETDIQKIDSITNGTAAANKALILDSSRNITNINNITSTGTLGVSGATTLSGVVGVGTTAPDKKLEINSTTGDCLRLTYNDADGSATNYTDLLITNGGDLTITPSGGDVNISSHNGSTTGLKLGDVLVTSTAAELNYVDVTAGAGTASKALVLDADKAISGITTLGATTINVTNLNITGSSGVDTLTTTGNVGIKTSALDYGLEINDAAGDVLRLSYNDANGGPSANRVDFQVSSTGTLTITPVGTTPSVNIAGHNGSTQGLQLGGTLVTSTATELNYVDVTPGTATASKALVLDSNLDIATINSLTATSITGTLQTAAQTNITTVGTLAGLVATGVVNVSSHDGSTTGLQLGGTLVTSTAAELNYVDVTAGTAAASKALVLDSSRDITNINALTASTLTGTLQTAAQTNITTVGTLAGLVATGVVNVSSHDGATTGLQLGGTLVTATAAELNLLDGVTSTTAELNYVDTTAGTVVASKAMVVDSSRNIVNLNNLRTTGNLGINTSSPDKQVEINSATGDCLRLTYNDADGTAATYLDNTISSAGVFTMTATGSAPGIVLANSTSVSSTLNVTGAVGVGTTAPDKKLEVNSSTGDCLRLTYNDADGTATNYTDLLITSGGDLTITPSGGDVNLSSHNGSTTGLKLNGTLVTSTAAELNYVDVTPGAGTASKALVLDANKSIIDIDYFEAKNIVGMKSATGNNVIDHPLQLYTLPANTAAVGLGTGIEFNSVNDGDVPYNAGYINFVSSDITENDESGFFDFKLVNGGTIDTIFTISNNGVASATSYVETSDIRAKENIQETISVDSLAKILQVHVKTYNYKKDLNKRHSIGVIAQELKEIIPESVVISKNDDFDDFHQVQYTSLIPHLINCIKVLHEELEELKSKL